MPRDQENQRKLWREWYRRNKQKVRKAVKDRKVEIREFINKIKTTSSCILCGESTGVCLDFHHLDPFYKEIEIAKAANRGWGTKKVMDELKKCVIVCSNCHRKIHAGLIKLPG